MEITQKPNQNQLERYLQEKIFPDLEQSRGGFDKIHTTEAVDWLKQIIEHSPDLKLDKIVLLIAAYAHDWGYSGLFKVGEVMDLNKIESAKKMHMIIGEKKIANLLEDDFFSFLTTGQKNRCIHLVAVHDKKFEIKDIDELVLMEAVAGTQYTLHIVCDFGIIKMEATCSKPFPKKSEIKYYPELKTMAFQLQM